MANFNLTYTGAEVQAMLDEIILKSPIASPTFTGTVGGITKSMVGLGNVDNTSDANKQISTATQTELNLKATITALNLKADKSTTTINVTASKTLALTDLATLQKCTSASLITITISLNSAVVFPINTEIALVKYGVGAVTIGGSGVTINSVDSLKSVKGQFGAVTLKKIATDEWLLIGSLE
jgi:hypothetical protein